MNRLIWFQRECLNSFVSTWFKAHEGNKNSQSCAARLLSYNALLLKHACSVLHIMKKYEPPCMRLTHIFRSLLWRMCNDFRGHWGRPQRNEMTNTTRGKIVRVNRAIGDCEELMNDARSKKHLNIYIDKCSTFNIRSCTGNRRAHGIA